MPDYMTGTLPSFNRRPPLQPHGGFQGGGFQGSFGFQRQSGWPMLNQQPMQQGFGGFNPQPSQGFQYGQNQHGQSHMVQPTGTPFGWGGQVAYTPWGSSYPAMYAPQQQTGTGMNRTWPSYGGMTPIQHMQQQADAGGGGGDVYAALGMQRPMQQQGFGGLTALMQLLSRIGQQQPGAPARPQARPQAPKKPQGFIDPITGEVGR